MRASEVYLAASNFCQEVALKMANSLSFRIPSSTTRTFLLKMLYVYLACLLASSSALPYSPQTKPAISSLIVFGDSYTSNGHNPDPYMNEIYKDLGTKGRAVTWPNIFLQNMKSEDMLARMYDYAYDGAPANNNLTYMGTVPDSRTQIGLYLADSRAGKVPRGNGQTLYVLWVGINSIKTIWFDACDPDRNGGIGAQSTSDAFFIKATQRVQQQIAELRYQVDLLTTYSPEDKIPPRFLVITMPDISSATMFQEPIQLWTKGDATKRKALTNLMQLLTSQYNTGLMSVIKQSNTLVYDISSIWNLFLTTPAKFGLTYVTGRCLMDHVVCKNIDQYLFYDHVHPIPRIHNILAQNIDNFVTNY